MDITEFFCDGDEENGHHACIDGHLTTASGDYYIKMFLLKNIFVLLFFRKSKKKIYISEKCVIIKVILYRKEEISGN